MHLLARTSLKTKLALLLAVPLLTVTVIAATAITSKVQTAQRLGALADLSDAAVAANELVRELQKERGMTALFIADGTSEFAGELAEQRAVSGAAWVTFQLALAPLDGEPDERIAAHVEHARSMNRSLEERRREVDNGRTSMLASFGYYSTLIGHLLDISVEFARLSDQPGLASQAFAYSALVREGEAAGQERGLLGAVLAGSLPRATLDEALNGAVSAIGAQQAFAADFELFASPQHRQFRATTLSDPAVDFAAQARWTILGSQVGYAQVEARVWFTAMTRKIDLLAVVEQRLADDLVSTAAALRTEAWVGVWFFGASTVLFLAFSAAGGFLVARSVSRPVHQLADVAKAMARGDLSQDVQVASTDALGDLADSFREMKAYQRTMARAATEVAQGDLDVEIVPRSQQDEMGHALGRMVSNLNASVEDLERAALDAERHAERARAAQVAAQRAANQDGLTGLANRSAFLHTLREAVDHAGRRGQPLHVFFIDLDRFKTVNDASGHAAGDALLRSVGARIAECTREGDSVARLGGDEFAVLTQGMEDDTLAAEIAERLLSSIGRPHAVPGGTVATTASIGVSVFPHDGQDPEALLRSADLAMYHAKQCGRDTFAFHSPEMIRRVSLRSAMEGRLRAAIEDQSLELHFQPLVDLPTGGVFGVEALLRWPQHPASINEVISVAEDSGLIIPLGRWVIEQAIRAASERDASGYILDLALNLSPVQFHQSDIARTILDVCERERFPARRLIVELTEAALPEDIDWVARQLSELREAGVRTAIDDFGAGHASLNYLRSLPVDILKLDRQFVADLPSGRTSAAIVEGTITIAHRLGLKVIAEGVETTEQKQFLATVGCDFAQGFLFSPALARDELFRFLEASTARAAA